MQLRINEKGEEQHSLRLHLHPNHPQVLKKGAFISSQGGERERAMCITSHIFSRAHSFSRCGTCLDGRRFAKNAAIASQAGHWIVDKDKASSVFMFSDYFCRMLGLPGNPMLQLRKVEQHRADATQAKFTLQASKKGKAEAMSDFISKGRVFVAAGEFGEALRKQLQADQAEAMSDH